MGLLVLPVSRNSLWTASLGIGWEAMIKWHGWMGDLFIALIFVHAGCFCRVYAEQGLDWWSNLWWNTGYDRDNWTITLQVCVGREHGWARARARGFFSTTASPYLSTLARSHFFFFLHVRVFR